MTWNHRPIERNIIVQNSFWLWTKRNTVWFIIKTDQIAIPHCSKSKGKQVTTIILLPIWDKSCTYFSECWLRPFHCRLRPLHSTQMPLHLQDWIFVLWRTERTMTVLTIFLHKLVKKNGVLHLVSGHKWGPNCDINGYPLKSFGAVMFKMFQGCLNYDAERLISL